MRWRSTAISLFLLTIACAPQEAPRADAAPEAIPVEGGRLVRRLEGDPGTLNFVMQSTAPEKLVLSYLHDPLIEIDRNLQPIAGLAAEWSVSDDRLTWTFRLDPNATFSDGKPVRASDLVFTLRKIVDPESQSVQYSGFFANLDVEKTRAIDDHAAEVVFTSARPDQIYAFNIPVLPRHVYSRGDFTTSFNDRVVGTGPYVIANRVRGQEILLQRREDYWRDAPYIDSILFRIIEDKTQAWNALIAGEVDEANVTTEQWLSARGTPAIAAELEFHRFYEMGYNFIPWNTRDPILSDPRVRRAMTMCLDRRLIIERLYYGTARIMTGPFTPNHWAFNPAVPAIEFDPAGARRLLTEAGWTDSDGDGVLDRDGKPFVIEMLLFAGDTTSATQAQIFQAELQKIGVRLELTRLDAATLFGRVLAGSFQATMLAWALDLDPDMYSLFHSSQFPPNGQNFVFYSNPDVDRLIEEGRRTFDQGRRQEIYRELHALLAADQPYTWTIQVSTKWGVNRRIRNVEEAEGLGLFGWYPGAMQWWIAPEDRRFAPERAAR
ncbi:MAG: ABC transporter substrate-binding protein [Thermoanaerobaculia bacterium]